MHWSGPLQENFFITHAVWKNYSKKKKKKKKKNESEHYNVLPESSGLIWKNLKTLASENYCTPWIDIWRYEDLETTKLSSKWLDLVLNDL